MDIAGVGQLTLERCKEYVTYCMFTKDKPNKEELRAKRRAEIFEKLYKAVQDDKHMHVGPLERFMPKDMNE